MQSLPELTAPRLKLQVLLFCNYFLELLYAIEEQYRSMVIKQFLYFNVDRR